MPILASVQCKFKIPLTYPDTVSVGTHIAKVEHDRFMMEYCVVSQRHQKIAAEGEGIIIPFNYRETKKTSLPEEVKQRIAAVDASIAKHR